MCLSCHDGSLVDSRNTAFAEHGHHLGRPDANVTRQVRQLPLNAEGRLTCMTCHKTHDGEAEEGTEDMHSFPCFTRLPGPRGALCLQCHPGYDRKKDGHFMGLCGFPAPEKLVALGAVPSADGRGQVRCRTCHLPHGPREQALLAGGKEGPCRFCHSGRIHEEDAHVRSGRFQCWDCHFAHGRISQGSAACEDCHPGQARIHETAHGTSPGDSACGPCHAPLRALRNPQKPACLDCHGLARNLESDLPRVSVFEHPGDRQGEAGCNRCHDPHLKAGSFLKPGVAEKVCSDCHGLEGLWRYLYFHQENRTPPKGR
jgi:predicted CXXCH cytochrome family protein